jgi:hypothetical protein
MKNENNTLIEEEILIDSAKIKNKEILTLKGKEINHNLGMGITLTSIDNNIHKSKTNNHINTSISNNNHPKLSTLSENEFLKNIIIDTAKKIKKNSNSTNHNYNKNNNINNLSLDNKSNSLFSPLNPHKSDNEQIRNNNVNNTYNNIINSKVLGLENGMSTLKTYSINNSNEIKENKNGKINDMNPLDMMNQVITTNSNIRMIRKSNY